MIGPARIGDRTRTVARTGGMFARSGLWRPGPPARVARQLGALRRWGTLLGGTWASAAARDPGRVAIIDDEGALTYAEVDRRTDRLALALGRYGEPSRIAVLCRNHRWMIETLVACSKRGADLVLLNTGMSAEQLLAVLERQHVEVVIADPEFADFLEAVPEKVRVITSGAQLESVIAGAPDATVVPPALAGRTIMLSSGTTGTPKGADRHSKPGLTPLASILSRIPFRVHERVMIEAPLFHTWGYAMLQTAISLRATIVLQRKFDPEGTVRALRTHGCTALVAVPVMLQRVMELPPAARPRPVDLRITAVSGSALPGALATAFMDAFGDVLYNLYGSTEASWVTIATPEDLRVSPDTAGTPPPGTRVAILDADGEPVPVGTTGRIFAANDLLFAGYTNGGTKEMLDGMMSLGDLGHLDAAGRLFVDGRDDDMVVSGGENIFPGAVEEVLLRMPEVREAVVVGVPDEEFGQRLAAHLVLEPGTKLEADEVRAHVRDHLARFAVPRDVHFAESLPRNATGKIMRRLLPTEPPTV
ncbi:AMP-binding protein [Actinomadura macrotermitis]|uniref:Putative acyl--CoA ligase YhfT n=1 Tax=Actinomadura macrotermitis TaxID=2585200 RepID=A0A7K0BVR0_9ACTN|nr:AMP-binding protein [Actinomadura macrotermitis]MQY04774.1 putative acyl--CoA ligase YhfT [Actinomadura macrotermitis]